ncbi:MAG: CaiB/BaiF CoA-transferase family protein [bacterium]
MSGALAGIRVLEVAQFWFVPAAGAILADWGAEVWKVEHPVHGDAQRGLAAAGFGTREGGVDFMMQQSNRGKRSLGIDLAKPEGRALLHRLAERCDVFLTNFLPAARTKLGIDVDDIRARNPRVIYVRGSGYGAEGPDRDAGGYDATAFWSRGGVAQGLTRPDAAAPVMQRPAFGDSVGALALAAGVAAALLKRERTGEASVVDVSLLGTAMWTMAPDIVASPLIAPEKKIPFPDRAAALNPLANSYRTADGRWIVLMALQGDRHWPEICERIGRPELVADPRFRDARARYQNRRDCVAALDAAFATETLAQWRARLAGMESPWAVMQSAAELHEDPQALANDYLPAIAGGDAGSFRVVASPVSFDGAARALAPSPELGQHTEEVLLELGLSWDELALLKASGAVG